MFDRYAPQLGADAFALSARALSASCPVARDDPSLGLIEIRASIDFYGVAPTTLDLTIPHRVDLLSVDCVDRPIPVETVHDIEAFVPASHFETLAVWRPEIALGVTEDEWRKMLAAPDDPCPAEGTVFDWQHGDLVRS